MLFHAKEWCGCFYRLHLTQVTFFKQIEIGIKQLNNTQPFIRMIVAGDAGGYATFNITGLLFIKYGMLFINVSCIF